MLITTPFEHHVPTDPRENLQWRKDTFLHVKEDPSYATWLYDACAADPFFYINGFLYTYDPRRTNDPTCLSAKIPFILWPFQRDGLMDIFGSIGEEDLLVEKSRDMGASWLSVIAFEYLWHFKKLMSFLMVSRDANYVDAPDNPKSLFWKIDFIHSNQPLWLMPKGFDSRIHRLKFHIKNPATESVIDGEATTEQVARGDRRTAILLDEFAAVPQGHKVLSSTRDVTKSRIFNSTPEGINNAYYTIRQTNIRKLRFFWTDHPLKREGLYRADKDGELEILDKEGYPEGYEPTLDGKWDPRSPWLDIQVSRAATDQEIYQEVMIDYLGSGHQFFLQEAVQEAIRKFACPPTLRGELNYDEATNPPEKFYERREGHLFLWSSLNREGLLSREHKYVLGCDISAGTGSSNSTGCAYDLTTNEKILEYANANIRPEEFAKQMVALAKWLGNALLIWESNGTGLQFGSRVLELRYGNIYYRKNQEKIGGKTSDIPGWHSAPKLKRLLIEQYREAVEKQLLINRSKVALLECLEYVFDPQGGVSHSLTLNRDDPTGARDNHGDRVIADALAWRGMSERKVAPRQDSEPTIPIGSLAWRREQKKKNTRKPHLELLPSEGW